MFRNGSCEGEEIRGYGTLSRKPFHVEVISVFVEPSLLLVGEVGYKSHAHSPDHLLIIRVFWQDFHRPAIPIYSGFVKREVFNRVLSFELDKSSEPERGFRRRFPSFDVHGPAVRLDLRFAVIGELFHGLGAHP